MRISYYSPKKNVKTFSFANLKPVLIFTADKNKEYAKDKEYIFGTNVKKKLSLDNVNKPNFENNESNISQINNKNQSLIQNGINYFIYFVIYMKNNCIDFNLFYLKIKH